MKTRSTVLGLMASVGILVSWICLRAEAANGTDPVGTYGRAAIDTTATCFPASPLNGREGILITNLGPNPIYCAFDSLVTTATGTPVATNEKFSMSLGYRKGTTATQTQVCCITTALQIAPADTRWMEIR